MAYDPFFGFPWMNFRRLNFRRLRLRGPGGAEVEAFLRSRICGSTRFDPQSRKRRNLDRNEI
jgi:hypothetical protein